MSLSIRSIIEKGSIDKERITFRALSDCDIGQYAVFKTDSVDGVVANGVAATFWFPDTKACKGDLVILYTKSGRQHSKPLENGHEAHFFYWGMSDSAWDDDSAAAVLIHVAEWEGKLVRDF